MEWGFDNTFARDLPWLGVRVDPVPVADPTLLALNEPLALDLGLDPQALRAPDGVAVLAGNQIAPGSEPIAQAYAGHQFGQLSPILGDGRAHLLGEVVDEHGHRRDIALKGSGRTPFSRGGDGRAVVGPVLREYLVGEFMHAVGIPTTRALAAVGTGEAVLRERPLPGAVLTRIASSHLRVGSLVLVATRGGREHLEAVVEYVRARHYPSLPERDPMALLSAIVEQQAELVASWMSVGFIHGVMNSDNMTLSGETIDYGPCAFLDAYAPETHFSSIDHTGRYRYSAQPAMAQWNLTRLAETLLPLAVGEDGASTDAAVADAQERVEAFAPAYERAWLDRFRAKLGLIGEREDDRALAEDLLEIAKGGGLDLPGLFRDLAARLRGEETPALDRLAGDQTLTDWSGRWSARVGDPHAAAQRMDRVNPLYIPRNHLVEEALAAAHAGELTPFADLLERLRSPFAPVPGGERYAEPADPGFTSGYVTFCGT